MCGVGGWGGVGVGGLSAGVPAQEQLRCAKGMLPCGLPLACLPCCRPDACARLPCCLSCRLTNLPVLLLCFCRPRGSGVVAVQAPCMRAGFWPNRPQAACGPVEERPMCCLRRHHSHPAPNCARALRRLPAPGTAPPCSTEVRAHARHARPVPGALAARCAARAASQARLVWLPCTAA